MTRRRGLILVFFGLVFAALALWLGSVLWQQALAPAAVPTQPAAITVPVVVAARSVAVRTVIEPDDLRVVVVPVELVPVNAISDLSLVVGKISKIPLVSGEMVMPHHLADPTNISQDLGFIIAEDQVVVALPTTALMSQINVLQPGDLVDILVSLPVPVMANSTTLGAGAPEAQSTQEALFTFNALQRTEISAIVVKITTDRSSSTATGSRSSSSSATPAPTATPDPSRIEPQAILLALSPQDALVLKHLQDAGGIIDLALRAPTSTQVFEVSPVTSDYLRDRFELVISK